MYIFGNVFSAVGHCVGLVIYCLGCATALKLIFILNEYWILWALGVTVLIGVLMGVILGMQSYRNSEDG